MVPPWVGSAGRGGRDRQEPGIATQRGPREQAARIKSRVRRVDAVLGGLRSEPSGGPCVSAPPDRLTRDFHANPDDERLFEALEERLFLGAHWDALVEAYRRRLESPSLAGDASRRAPLLFRLAQILEERCDEIEEARQLYWEVARLDPGFRPALRQLRGIHASREQWDLFLQIAEIESRLPMKPYEQAELSIDLGRAWLAHMSDPEQALACFDRALEVAQGDPGALDGRARALQALGRYRDAAETWERLAAVQRGPDRAPTLVAWARLLAGPLRDPERALETYRRALTDDPRNEDAVESLSVLAAAQGRYRLLADLYERRFDLAAGARRRTAIALEAGTLHLDRLDDPQVARLWLRRALELCPEDPTVHQSLADLERRAGNTEGLREALDRVVELSGASAPPSVLLEAAHLRSERGDDEGAVRCLDAARARDAASPLVLDALADALRRLGRHAELADVLEQRAGLGDEDADARTEALVELGHLQESELGDPEAAVLALSRALDLAPGHGEALDALERLHRKAEAWEPLCALLERAHGHGPDPERVRRLCALGELRRQHFDDAAGARAAFEAALELDASAPRALAGVAQLAGDTGDEEALLLAREREAAATDDPERLRELVPELERLLEARGRGEEALSWAEHWLASAPEDREALEATARWQRSLGRDKGLVATLTRLDVLLSGAEQAANRVEIARLQADDDGEAVGWLERAVQSQPDDAATLELLAGALERAGRTAELARVWRRLAPRLAPAERGACLDRLARLLAEELGDAEAAAVVLWDLFRLGTGPDDVAGRLETLLARSGRWEEVAQLLAERRQRLPADAPEAAALERRRAGLLLDPLGQAEAATAAYRALLERDPSDAAAADGLEESLRASRDAVALCTFLAERAAREPDPERRAERELERGTLLEEAVGDADAASEIYGRLVSDAAAPPALRARASERLEDLLERACDWAALRHRWEARMESLPGPERADLLERLGALCRDQLGEPGAAAAHLEEAGRLEPGRARVWAALALLHRDAGRDEDHARALEAELATDPEPAREQSLRAGAARLARARGDAETARRHSERLLELDPGHSEASRFLLESYEREQRPRDVLRLLELRLERAGSPAEASSLRLRMAGLLADALDDVDAACRVLEEAPDPDEEVTAEPLAELYARAGREDDLLALCRRRAAAVRDPLERASWRERLGRRIGRRDDPEASAEAVTAWRGVLADRPGDAEARAALCDLHRRRGETAPLARLLAERLEPGSGEDALPLHLERARLLAGPLERADEALEHYRTVLAVAPDHTEAFAEATAVAERLGRHTDVVALIEERLGGHPGPQERAALLARKAALLAGPLESPEDALPLYREALCLAPGPAVRRELRGVLEGLGRWSAALDTLYLEASEAPAPERTALVERAAEIAARELSDDAALPWLERLRGLRPDDPSVPRAIADLHRRAGRPECLLRALDDELRLVEDADRRRAVRLERARVLEAAQRAPFAALGELMAARDEAGDDAEVLEALDRLAHVLERPRLRLEVVEARLERGGSAGARELHRTAAELCEERLREPGRAAAHWLRAVSLCPDEAPEKDELLARLSGSLRAAGQAEAWARSAEAELARPPRDDDDRERKAALALELGRTCDTELGRPADAQRLWSGLVDGSTPEPVRRAAEAELLDALRRADDAVALERRLAGRLERDPACAEEWLELARLREERLHRPASAAAAYRGALERRPDALEALRGLGRCSARLGDWDTAAGCLEREAEAAGGGAGPEASHLWREAAALCCHRLGDDERAARALDRALEAWPEDVEAVRDLAALRRRQGDASREQALLEREIGLLGEADPERRRDLWLRVGALRRAQGDLPGPARDAWDAAAAAAPLAPADQRTRAGLHRETGDAEGYAELLGAWCDDPASGAGAADLLELARALADLGRQEDASRRARDAAEAAPDEPEAWELLAGLEHGRGELLAAAEALERAAAALPPREAAARAERAAAWAETVDADAAARILRRGAMWDPANGALRAAQARVAAVREDWETAEVAAGAAFDLLRAGAGLDGDERLATALAGGRAARTRGQDVSAARFFREALGEAPEHPEALEGLARSLQALGDWDGARRAWETLLGAGAREERADGEADRLAALGAVLERCGDPERALEHFEAALALDPDHADAHAGRAHVHACAGRERDAEEALVAWARRTLPPGQRAALLERAAVHAERRGDLAAAAGHREQATAAAPEAPESAPAWRALATHWLETGRPEAARAQAEQGFAAVADAGVRGALALVHGRALERLGRPREAAESYETAVEADPRCHAAALAAASLHSARGAWERAAALLEAFATGHPEPSDASLARVHLERARLLAGPLEAVEAAVAACECALALEPDRPDALEMLAGLLVHVPGRRARAAACHRRLLRADPTRCASLRALASLAEIAGEAEARGAALHLLGCLGEATETEAEQASPQLPLRLVGEPELADPLAERLRRAVQEAGREISEVLGAGPPAAAEGRDESERRFHAARREAERGLGAPGLESLSDEDLGHLLQGLVMLAGDARGPAPRGPAAALEAAVSWRTRRRLRRLLEDVGPDRAVRVEPAAWREALRELSAAVAADGLDAGLRGPLTALAVPADEPLPPPGAALAPAVAAAPQARALLARAALRAGERVEAALRRAEGA